MPSTYTTNGGIELIDTGEQSGTWGDTTNDNLEIIDRLTNGVGTISLTGTTHTLTTSDGALSDGQYAVLVFGGTPSGTNTVTISPNTNQHVYIVRNTTSQSVVLTQGSGGNVTVPAGKSAIVYADGDGAGAAVVDVTNTFNFQPLDAELTAIAALATTDGNFIVGDGSTWVAESGSTARTSLGLGSIATQAANNVSITGGSITGITDLAVADGGTGVSTVPTNGQLLIGNGTGYTVAALTAGSGVSITNGSGSVTINATGSGGTVTNVATGTGLTGGPITSTGTISVATNGITNTLLRDSSALSVIGRSANSTGDPADISAGTDHQVLRRSGTSLGFGSIALNQSAAVTGTLPVANGGTGATTLTANNVLLGNGTSALQVVAPGTSGNVLTSNGTTWTSAAPAGGSVSYPQESKSADYTLVLADAGKQIFHPASDANIRTFTIPANSSVSFPIGTVVLFTVENGSLPINVAINSDELITNKNISGTAIVSSGNTLYCIKVSSTKWLGYYMYQNLVSNYAFAMAHGNSPYISIYTWGGSGYGVKYENPAALPAGTGTCVSFSPARDAVVVGHLSSPYISAYSWSNSGFNTKYSNPSSLPSSYLLGVQFSPAGDAIVAATINSPYIVAYAWSNSSGFGTKFSDPATLPTGLGRAIAFSPAGDAVVISHSTSPFITAYAWSGSGFGAKFSDPATLPTGDGNDVVFSPAGDAIAVAHSTSPFITAYAWSGSGFGTKFSNPATLPPNNGTGVAFSPAGDAIAVTNSVASSPYITAYPWSGSGFGTKFSDPSVGVGGNANMVAFSPEGDYIAIVRAATPYLRTYAWSSSSGFGSLISSPSDIPGSGEIKFTTQ